MGARHRGGSVVVVMWLSRGACSRWCLESRGDVRRLVVARALALAGRERRTWGSLTLFLVTSYLLWIMEMISNAHVEPVICISDT